MHLLVVLLLLAPTPTARAEAMEVLREWDAARTVAYAEGDREALGDLYAPGAGSRDLAVLADYQRRGLAVWQRTQVFSSSVRSSGPGRLDLRVTDRTMTVIGDGIRCRALPTTQPVTRDIRFRRVGGDWLVASVRAAPPAAPR